MKDKAIIIGLFWIIYVTRSTIFSDVSIIKGILYPLYMAMVINATFTIKNNRMVNREIFWNIVIFEYILTFTVGIGIIGMDYVSDASIFKKLFMFLLPIICFLQMPSIVSVRLLMLCQQISSLLISIWIIFYNVTVSGFNYRGGIEVNQNFVSLMLTVGLLAALFELLPTDDTYKRSKIVRYAQIFTLFLGIYSLFILGSRGVSLSFALASFALIALSLRHIQNKFGLFSIGLIFSAVLLFLPGSQNLFNRILGSGVGTLNGRLPLWSSSLSQFFDNNIIKIFIGEGLGASRIINNNINPVLESSHSGFIQFLIEFGIVGFTIFITVFFIASYHNSKMNCNLNRFGISLIFFMFLINITAAPDNYIFWICLGQIFAIGGIEKESRIRNSLSPKFSQLENVPNQYSSI